MSLNVLGRGLARFLLGLPLAALLAVAGAASCVGVWLTLLNLSPPGPDGMPAALAASGIAWIVFAHAWVALFLTAWHLRRQTPGFTWRGTVVKTTGWAAVSTLVLALMPLGLLLAQSMLQPARLLADTQGQDVRLLGDWLVYSPSAGGVTVFGLSAGWLMWTVLWVVLCLARLPARAALGRATPRRRLWGPLLIAMAPWLGAIMLTGFPSQACRGECWGIMEGGLFMLPITAMHVFLITVSLAAVTAAEAIQAGKTEAAT